MPVCTPFAFSLAEGVALVGGMAYDLQDKILDAAAAMSLPAFLEMPAFVSSCAFVVIGMLFALCTFGRGDGAGDRKISMGPDQLIGEGAGAQISPLLFDETRHKLSPTSKRLLACVM